VFILARKKLAQKDVSGQFGLPDENRLRSDSQLNSIASLFSVSVSRLWREGGSCAY